MSEPMSHALLTGPITGLLTLADGTKVDVSPDAIEVDPSHVDELCDLIGKHWEANGHPHDIEVDEDSGELVQRDFVYVPKEG